jgi:hypothetical protein
MCSKPAFSQQVLTTYQTTFCDKPLPHTYGQMSRFQVDAIADDHDAVEGQPRFRAIPGDELVDGILIW